MDPVVVIGAGLAGSEAALQLAHRGIPVRLYEMKPARRTEAQVSDHYAELVCSNSFRGAGIESAVGAIKEEMRRLGSQLMRFAEETKVPAGGALAVDREKFSACVEAALRDAPNLEVISEEVTSVPDAEHVVVATGPLTAPDLAASIKEQTGGAERLYFYDAIAPILDAETINKDIVFSQSRYDKGEGADYLNCPMDQVQYEGFVQALLDAEKVTPHAFEEAKYFEGCLPIEVMASRGPETLRYGCMKPVGLTDPRTGNRPHAVVQLRTENRDFTAYNLVGFQTRMKWGPQRDVLRMIPGLEQAEFLRMGSIHRNTYIDSPSLLNIDLSLKTRPGLYFAGQITGVEGYVESTACGLFVALMLAAKLKGVELSLPPETTTLGSLHGHVLGLRRRDGLEGHGHVPSNIHWGLVPPLTERTKKRDRKRRYGERALSDVLPWRDEVKAKLGLLPVTVANPPILFPEVAPELVAESAQSLSSAANEVG